MSDSTSPFTVRPLPNNWEELGAKLQVPSLTARVLAARGIKSSEDLDLVSRKLLRPDGLPDIKSAAARVVRAIQNQEHILISGDFDADGATATTLGVDCLKKFGAKNVSFAVPNRFEYGYGLGKSFVAKLLVEKPDLIITVDNGVSSVEGVAFARESGVDVIVTDHHLPPDQLPPAHAIVNPKMKGSTFQSEPAGVGVAFYLMIEIRRQLRSANHFQLHGIDEPNLMAYLDLVALGTVADMVPLDFNNRLLVKLGLEIMRRGQCRPGLQVFIERYIKHNNIDEEDIGYRLAPRLNAAGRLVDISVGIKALLTQDATKASKYLDALSILNRDRQELQEKSVKHAFKLLRHESKSKPGLVLYDRQFREGVVGLVSGSVCRHFHRPTITFADSNGTDGNLLKGSGRSIKGVHIRDILAYIDAKHPCLLRSFGGHAAAAGLTIHKESFIRFRVIFEDVLEEQVEQSVFNRFELTDGEMTAAELSLELAEQLLAFGPWGMAFPRPLFHGEFRVIGQEVIGKGKHLKLKIAKDRRVVEALAFSETRRVKDQISISYHPSINRYQGIDTLQLMIQHITPSSFVSSNSELEHPFNLR